MISRGFDPPRFLKDGDVVECAIEGIGSIVNRVKQVKRTDKQA
jgi:2-keto-4-pentenoate hydratase/2-oxohepta-3-ene-1,7-dioic acid hydratase in catechol pathway